MTIEELKAKIATKAKELAADQPRKERIANRTDGPQLGDMYILPTDTELDDIGVEWVVVRFHIDDANTVLIVPLDMVYLRGVADICATSLFMARCGQSMWIERSRLHYSNRVNEMPLDVVQRIRSKVAWLANGDLHADALADDDNPDYQDHNDALDNLREAIKKKYRYQE